MSVLSTAIDYVDLVVLLIITAVAYDALRQLDVRHAPVRSLAFVCLCIGAFGWTTVDLSINHVPWWAFVFHIGVGTHSLVRFKERNFGTARYDSQHLYRR